MSDLLSASVRNEALEHATACHHMLCIAVKGTESFSRFPFIGPKCDYLNWFDFFLTFNALGRMMFAFSTKWLQGLVNFCETDFLTVFSCQVYHLLRPLL